MALPDVMRAVVLTGHGGLDKLEFREDWPTPVAAAGEVLVRVGACGLNNTDINTRTAWYSKNNAADADASWAGQALSFPRIQGGDVCGEIVATGSEVTPGRIGERVILEPCLRELDGIELDRFCYLGSECDGGFAEYVKIAARHAYRIDSSLSDVDLASFPIAYSTAENLLTRADVRQGDRVLITGASGGVGSAAIQLAQARRATVVAVTSPSKEDAIRALDVEEIHFHSNSLVDSVGENSIDVVIDLVAGPRWPELLEILKPGGRYAVAGAIGGPMVELDVRTLYLKDLTLYGCTGLSAGVFRNLVARIEQGDVQPLVAATFPLDRIVEAQERFLRKDFTGKLVLTV